jgi:hypothetical protein
MGGVGLVVVAGSGREPGVGGHPVGADEDFNGVAAVHDRGLIADVLEGHRVEVFALAEEDVVVLLDLCPDRFFE